MPQDKPGDVVTFEIDGQKLIVEPIPFGNLKKLLKLMNEMSEKGKAGDTQVLSIPSLLENYADPVIPLLFKAAKHPFLTKEWIDEHLTVPILKDILQAASAVNGFPDFLGNRGAPANGGSPKESEGASENSGSTMPSGSPTAGDRATSTA